MFNASVSFLLEDSNSSRNSTGWYNTDDYVQNRLSVLYCLELICWKRIPRSVPTMKKWTLALNMASVAGASLSPSISRILNLPQLNHIPTPLILKPWNWVCCANMATAIHVHCAYKMKRSSPKNKSLFYLFEPAPSLTKKHYRASWCYIFWHPWTAHSVATYICRKHCKMRCVRLCRKYTRLLLLACGNDEGRSVLVTLWAELSGSLGELQMVGYQFVLLFTL